MKPTIHPPYVYHKKLEWCAHGSSLKDTFEMHIGPRSRSRSREKITVGYVADVCQAKHDTQLRLTDGPPPIHFCVFFWKCAAV